MNRAMWYLILAVSLFAVMNAGVKFIPQIPASEVVVFRGLTSLVLCLFFIWKKQGRFIGKNKKILFARGFSGTIALFSLFTVIQKIPLAVASTLINLTPILTVFIAHIFLKEKANFKQWVFLILSFIGVILVRGGVEPVPWIWMSLGLVAAFFAAIAYTCVRILRTTEDPLVVILYFPLVTIPMVGPVMIYEWVTPTWQEWAVLLGIGLITQVAQYFMTLAYQMEKAAKIMVFNYTGLFWGVIFGYTLFDEPLTWGQVSGVLLVFFCLCGNYYVSLGKKSVQTQ